MKTLGLFALLFASPQEKIKVVTTLPVLADLAREVGGERVTTEALASPKADPHNVTPTTTLMQKAARADLFVELGMQLDKWAGDVVASSGNTRIQRGTPGFVTASANCVKGEFPKELSRAGGDTHPDGNPHVWLDPLNAIPMARTIADALKRVDPAGAATYDARADDFEKRVYEALIGPECTAAMKPDHVRRLAARGKLLEFIQASETLKPKLGGWAKRAEPLRGIKVVSYHKTYFYLAQRFGFEIAVELEPWPGSPPPPQHKSQVVKIAKDQGVRLILNDAFYPRDAADYVASETGAKVLITAIDVGGAEGADTYFKLIDRLLDGLVGSLR
jgi:ABC-type Zn uptake system ZnuABC Zn-binding protein ZnuA